MFSVCAQIIRSELLSQSAKPSEMFLFLLNICFTETSRSARVGSYHCLHSMLCHGTGALVGPPWSKRENGFVLSETRTNGIRLYYEPHCDYDEAAVAKIGKVDAVVTPANSQVLVTFPLVCLCALCL